MAGEEVHLSGWKPHVAATLEFQLMFNTVEPIFT